MYDLHDDPFELVNLFNDAGYKKIRSELREMMLQRPGSTRAVDLPRVAVN